MSELDNLPGRAADQVRQVERCWHKMAAAAKQSSQEVAVHVGSPLGVHRVSWLFPMGESIIMVSVVSGGTLLLPVEQCVFHLEIIKRTPKKSRVIVGFGSPPEDKETV